VGGIFARIGVLSDELRAACLGALELSGGNCRAYAARYVWPEGERVFIDNVFRARGATPTRQATA
jgi:hypothetical protein